MDREKGLHTWLDFLKGSEITKDGFPSQDMLDASAPTPSRVENEATTASENNGNDKKLQEKIDRSMDAIKEFIRNIDINRL